MDRRWTINLAVLADTAGISSGFTPIPVFFVSQKLKSVVLERALDLGIVVDSNLLASSSKEDKASPANLTPTHTQYARFTWT